jgi:oligopeptide/dipeptide ABC transporter ATP-binding protein
VLAVRDLRTVFATNGSLVRAVDGVSVTVPRHGRVGLAGSSGSGKTQTALSVLGLLDAAPGIIGGDIWIDGRNVLDGLGDYCSWEDRDGHLTVSKDVGRWRALHERRLTPLRGEVLSMVVQEPRSALIPHLTVGEHLRETMAARGMSEDAVSFDQAAEAMLERLRFNEPKALLRRYPHALSGGESQRVLVGLALLGRPDLLIADEPTTQLDAVTQRHVLDTLTALIDEADTALLLIAHDLDLLRLLTDRLVVLFAGTVVERGPTDGIARSPDASHPYTQALLRAQHGALDVMPEPLRSTERNLEGCRYYHRCALKDALPPSVRQRCRHERPPPVAVIEDHTVACWGRARDGASLDTSSTPATP